ncbi:MAG: CopG family transcriptional regulator [Clostridia bacterium]|nr:CopG family transcriptional regulator [Clostridia bacterium]
MIRTQIQLEERQFSALKAKAAAEGVSIAELVRRGVEMVLGSTHSTPEERISRAIEAAGRFHSGLKDLSTEHDKYLAEALK